MSETVSTPPTDANTPNVNSRGVSAVPTPGALSDPKPEQTDNRERPEDGEQDVSQDPIEVLSEDEDLNDDSSEDEDPDAAA